MKKKTVDMYSPKDRAEAGKIFLSLKAAFGDKYDTYTTDGDRVMYHNQEVFWTFGMGRSASRGDPAPYMRGDISVCLYQKNSGKPFALAVNIELDINGNGNCESEDFQFDWTGKSAAKFLTVFKRARRVHKQRMARMHALREHVARLESDMAARMGIILYGAEEVEREYDGSEMPPRRPYDPKTITFGRQVIKRTS